MNKSEITTQLNREIDALEKTISGTDDAAFFLKESEKWSAAENTQHLTLSARPLVLAFSLPRFVFRFYGKPYRPSYPFDEIVKRYLQLLKDGAKATGMYVPRGVPVHGDKRAIIERFLKINRQLAEKFQSFEERELDAYFLPHPLLGKLTVREMMYFTVYHIRHHHNIILERITASSVQPESKP